MNKQPGSWIISPLSRPMLVGVLAGLGLLLPGMVQKSVAQTTTPQPLSDLQNSGNSADPFSRSQTGGQTGVFNLIHQAIQKPSQSPEEFSTSQQENLDSAAAEFRAKQLEMLQRPTAQPQTAPATTSNPAN